MTARDGDAVTVDGPMRAQADSDAGDLLELLSRLHPTWHRRAACSGMVELAYPSTGGNRNAILARCAICPVVTQCADAGRDEVYGVWGGQVKAGLAERTKLQQRADATTDRTARVLALRAQGRSLTQIANDMGMHRPNVCRIIRLAGCTHPRRDCGALVLNLKAEGRLSIDQIAAEVGITKSSVMRILRIERRRGYHQPLELTVH